MRDLTVPEREVAVAAPSDITILDVDDVRAGRHRIGDVDEGSEQSCDSLIFE